MTHFPEITPDFEKRKAVLHILRGANVDGPVGIAVDVLCCVYGLENTYYFNRRSTHAVVVRGAIHKVPDAVDQANEILRQLGLVGQYIAYPGARTDPLNGLNNRRLLPVNDNRRNVMRGAV
ncbi:hypothetical protein [Thalassospira mesophila]|uniref:Uncharacterized protein n=1 Tax=Thalassospira mesophila TaxID=1293891 RepID=A0A1Y2L1L0_9PROT|nr:hypothetical protein [Thalassospira mesophila]OSQ38995.1 hypothetical protein TMES_09875 [Thalassospira mesophila]